MHAGEIPPQVFINNLINGLSDHFKIIVYGLRVKNTIKGHSKKIEFISNSKFYIYRRIKLIYRILYCMVFKYSKLKSIYKKLGNKPFKLKLYHLDFILPVILFPPDILHFQWPSFLKHFQYILDDFIVVVSMRGQQMNINPFVYPDIFSEYLKMFKYVDAFHAVSDDIILKTRPLIQNGKIIRVIRPAVNESLIKISNDLWNHNAGEKLNIISVGTNRWKKGYSYALDCMKLLKDKGFNFHYTMIVKGKDVENIHYQINDLCLQENVRYIDGLNHSDVLIEIKKVVCFCYQVFQRE